MHYFLRVIRLLLDFITISSGRPPLLPGRIAFDDVCERVQSIPDNLSCQRADGVLQCFANSQLCDGLSDCSDGADEGVSLNGLDCK